MSTIQRCWTLWRENFCNNVIYVLIFFPSLIIFCKNNIKNNFAFYFCDWMSQDDRTWKSIALSKNKRERESSYLLADWGLDLEYFLVYWLWKKIRYFGKFPLKNKKIKPKNKERLNKENTIEEESAAFFFRIHDEKKTKRRKCSHPWGTLQWSLIAYFSKLKWYFFSLGLTRNRGIKGIHWESIFQAKRARSANERVFQLEHLGARRNHRWWWFLSSSREDLH